MTDAGAILRVRSIAHTSTGGPDARRREGGILKRAPGVSLAVFEVTDTDLAGRIGRLSVGGRKIETPAFLPVVHPLKQQVPVSVISGMGFGAVITNAYITMARHPEGVDIHSLIGFDGVIMTDSGGYQVLEYGSVKAEPVQMAEYQAKIGSDIAVILDEPTGYPASRRHAESTVENTLRAARDSLPVISKKPPLWAGPVQGGTHQDLVRRSARSIAAMPFDLFAIGSPVELMNGYRFREVSSLVSAAKGALPPDRPVHLFGAGHPFMIPLAVALGCDMFDSASYILFAKEGRYMTSEGVRHLADMQELPCGCRACSSTDASALKEMPPGERTVKLAVHNLSVMRDELVTTREALREGRLWDHLTYRLRSHPSLTGSVPESMLELMEQGTGIDKPRALFLYDEADLAGPEVRRHRERVMARHSKWHERLRLVVPGDGWDGAFMMAQSLVREADKDGLDVAFFHPFFSVVPAALVPVYPLSQNGFPAVVGRGVLRDSVSFLSSFVKKQGYSGVQVVCREGGEAAARLILRSLAARRIPVSRA